MELIEAKHALRRALDAERARGRCVGLVPTMGALHAGHLSIIDAAAACCDIVAVTIFVNPLQFGDPADLAAYPRDLRHDLELCEDHGAGVVFAPTAIEMYPSGPPQTVVEPGALASFHEGASRPGHFSGVATVVTKLFSLAGACRAFFGEKDFQQLAIIRQIVADLDLPVEIEACPVVRESDGLALSSRNARLAPAERTAAAALWRALDRGRSAIADGERRGRVVAETMLATLAEEPLAEPDYAAVSDPATLRPVEQVTGAVRLLVAATLGSVRLIDNLAAQP